MDKTLAKNFAEGVTGVLAEVLGPRKQFVPLHEPAFNGNEKLYLSQCIDSTYVSSAGEFVDRFEEEIAQTVGVESSVAVVNGTAGLHLALEAVGVRECDEVILPALSFVGTANAVRHAKAVPVFLDVERESLGICPEQLENWLLSSGESKNGSLFNKATGARISAVLAVHIFGHPCRIEKISAICKRYNVPLVEDCAEALGSKILGKHCGTFGEVGVFSFNGNKILTTGGGGAIVSNSNEIVKKAKHLATTAKLPHAWRFLHDEVGYNYRMPNLNAALGCAQLEQLDHFLISKRQLFKIYSDAFSELEGVEVLPEPSNANSNFWLQALILDEANVFLRDAILETTNRNKIGTRPIWDLLPTLEPYKSFQSQTLNVAKAFETKIINIPSSASLI